MDYESWRCKYDDHKFCPPEGCPKSYGCARDRGWKPGDPTPAGCLPQRDTTEIRDEVNLDSQINAYYGGHNRF